MTISPVKRLVLETMWMLDKPLRAVRISKVTGVSFPSVMMHIIGLTRMGYVESPEKGYYVISEKGRNMLGLQELDEKEAAKILKYQVAEKSFHFYADIGKPLDIHAASLGDFCKKILEVDLPSLEFHADRGDFEAWFTELGDVELARKALIIRGQKIIGENLRKRLYEIVKKRYDRLVEIRSRQLHSNTSEGFMSA